MKKKKNLTGRDTIEDLYLYKIIELIDEESKKTNRSKSNVAKELIEFYKFKDCNSLIRARYIIKNELLRGKDYKFVIECRRLFLFLNFILNKIKKEWY